MLPVVNSDVQVLILQSCQWSGNECVAWDAEVLESNWELPEELKVAVLGGRRRILFVEGASRSLDLQFYRALFPDASVKPDGKLRKGYTSSTWVTRVEGFASP